jgi:hypothetical protein
VNILETNEDFEKKDKINRDLFGRKGNNSQQIITGEMNGFHHYLRLEG